MSFIIMFIIIPLSEASASVILRTILRCSIAHIPTRDGSGRNETSLDCFAQKGGPALGDPPGWFVS